MLTFWKSIVSLFLSLLVISCGDQAFYEVNKAIPNRSWNYSEIPVFSVRVTDRTAKYNLWVNLRHSNEYNYANVFLLIHEKGPAISDTAIRYELKLAELDGRWLGKSAGNLYSVERLLKENYSFPDTGLYTFSIEQNMRENPLRDISDIGLKIVKKP
ncbi:gliding motility lipoprotein GldH [Sphingobacterium sp. LRF_L2]|uniref:gliding motility lipoprotein GldH n=1 Tax=Sphingobacterium sp. LRF_L2 TaxID=3369421 RepID=UPI003F61052E